MTTNPTLSDMMAAAVRAAGQSVDGPVDVEIVAYYPSKQAADVRPLVKTPRMVNGELTYAEVPTVYDVPVRFPHGGGRGWTWGLDRNDRGTAIPRRLSHDEVDAGSSVPSEPASTRTWNYADWIVLPGATPPAEGLPSRAWREDGQAVFEMPDGEAAHFGASTASLALALAQQTAAKLAAIEGVINGLVLPVSGASAGPPAVPPFPTPTVAGDIQTTRIKVDSQ